MDAKQVIDKILSDARAKADEIKKQTQEKQAADNAELDKQLQQYRQQTKKLADKTAEEHKAHILAEARMDVAKEYLAEKRMILDEVFQKAATELGNLDDEQYRKLMKKLLGQVTETGDEEIIIDENETRIDEGFIEQLNRDFKSSGKGNLTLSRQKLGIDGGFIARAANIKTNASFEVLIDRAKEHLEIELAKKLFADEE